MPAASLRASYSSSGRTVRLGAVSYLNTEPHLHGLLDDQGFRVERDVPSRVARRLHAGDVDLGLIPSIEYAFGAYAIVPGDGDRQPRAGRLGLPVPPRARSTACGAWRSTPRAGPAWRW